jgi:murein DD-endopeptidase MepM/ murein hydrolase activator NlpD
MKTLISTVLFCAGLWAVSETVNQPNIQDIWQATLDGSSGDASPLVKNSPRIEEKIASISIDKNVTLENPTLNSGEALAIRKLAEVKQRVAEPKINIIKKTVSIGRGEILVDVIAKAGASKKDALMAIRALKGSVDPRRIKTGQKVFITLIKDNKKTSLKTLGFPTNFDTLVTAERTENGGFKKSQKAIPTVTLRQVRTGTIEGSLYLAAQKSNVPTPVLTDLIRIFSYDVDFQREIRKGDSFKLYFERKMRKDTGQIEEGKILFAELTLRGKPIGFYHFKAKGKSSADYFDNKGRSAQKALMKTPIDGARLSSSFGRRKHPILGYTKLHTGVDFGARRGTPIMASGDGVIEKAGRNGVYGNYIRIRHNGTYKSAYGHMKSYARGIRAGRRVKQGQIIGYVGSTGRSTAPHLHYEVFVNGRVSNPMRLKFPTGKQLKNADFSNFNKIKAALIAEMDTIQEKALMASLHHDAPLGAKTTRKTDEY